MALMLGAQLTASYGDSVVYFYYRPACASQIRAWLKSLHPAVRENIRAWPALNLAEVEDKLRGHRFSKVFVDHAIHERSEQDLADHIAKLQQAHANSVAGKETIR